MITRHISNTKKYSLVLKNILSKVLTQDIAIYFLFSISLDVVMEILTSINVSSNTNNLAILQYHNRLPWFRFTLRARHLLIFWYAKINSLILVSFQILNQCFFLGYILLNTPIPLHIRYYNDSLISNNIICYCSFQK